MRKRRKEERKRGGVREEKGGKEEEMGELVWRTEAGRISKEERWVSGRGEKRRESERRTC